MNQHLVLVVLGVFDLVQKVSEHLGVLGFGVDKTERHHGSPLFVKFGIGTGEVRFKQLHRVAVVVLVNHSQTRD